MYKQDNWNEYLPAAEFAYNNAKQAFTEFIPFELDCGFMPLMPITIMTELVIKIEAADKFVKHWNIMIKMAKDNLKDAQERQTKYANQHRRHCEFKLGDMVLLSIWNVTTIIDRQRPMQKLTPKYMGPFRVIQVISPMAYKLELPENIKMHPVFHISLLKKYKTSEEFV